MYELDAESIKQVSGGYSDLVIGTGALATALSRGNPVLASATAGYTLGTAIQNNYGTQISNWVWSTSQRGNQLARINPHAGRAF